MSITYDSAIRLCFVRFGRKDGAFPVGEVSYNKLTGEPELGVSVYEAVERGGQYQLLLPRLDPMTIATIGMCFNTAQGLWGQTEHPLYEVEGDFVGIGSDGEPLLKNCRVVRRIFGNNTITVKEAKQ